MAKTKIQWADRVWNPITGCTPVSEGCKHCYAMRMANTRLRGRCGYPSESPFSVTFHPERLDEPAKWKEGERVFVCSMGDLFHEDVLCFWLADVFAQMAAHPHLTFMLLTKRPENMHMLTAARHMSGYKWFGANVWVGVTAENQACADVRLPVLAQVPALCRFVSVEPMLGPVDISAYIGSLDWVICGCETGPHRRITQLEWVRGLRDQCVAAGIPFFLKQLSLNGRVVKTPALDGQKWLQIPQGGEDAP